MLRGHRSERGPPPPSNCMMSQCELTHRNANHKVLQQTLGKSISSSSKTFEISTMISQNRPIGVVVRTRFGRF